MEITKDTLCPYLDQRKYADHMIRISETVREVEWRDPSLARKLRRELIVLEHDRHALLSQLEAMECIKN